MHKTTYNTREWRDLPRDYCLVDLILGDAAGPCRGLIHHHHVDPTDPDSRTVQVCAGHHPKIHSFIQRMNGRLRRCPHRHPTREGRDACERRLNRLN